MSSTENAMEIETEAMDLFPEGRETQENTENENRTAEETAIKNIPKRGPEVKEPDESNYTGTATIRPSMKKAEEAANAMTTMPKQMALITLKDLQYALTPVENRMAYVRKFADQYAKRLILENGKLIYNGENVTNADLYYMRVGIRERVNEIDLPMLQTLYSLVLTDMMENAESQTEFVRKVLAGKYEYYTVTVYARKLIEMMGLAKMQNPLEYLERRISQFNSIFGVILEGYDVLGRELHMNVPVLVLLKTSDKYQTITFTSPYLNEIIKKTIQEALGKRGREQLRMLRAPKRIPLKPINSYLVNSDIASEKNVRAVEIVQAVVTLIEQAGDSTPHIRAVTILNRCANLKQAYDAATGAHKSEVLKRAFKRAWQILPTKTKLTEAYEGIELPDPDDPDSIPTVKTLNDMVFDFPHNGKTSRRKNA